MEIKNISDRASYVEKENELSVVIIANTDKTKITNILLLLALWLAGGIVVAVNYFAVKDEKTKMIMLVWIAFWVYFDYIMLKGLLWTWKGREIFKFRDGEMFYKKDTGGRGWVNSYELEKISNVHAHEEKKPNWLKKLGTDYWSTDCDSIRFDYGDKEIAIGYRLSEKELSKMIFLLKNYRR
ncbi:MAG TPA: hypothetical protein VL651_09310 [Bacteroidia bacterium]|jgi:hypothetical protein|nr:hypothetical protein [Bacteroidia bacterium]